MLRRTTISASEAVKLLPALRDPGMYVDAAWVSGKRVSDSNAKPPHTVLHTCSQRPLGTVPNLDTAQVNAAIDAANAAFPAWAATAPAKRAKVLMKWADLMAQHAEDGSTIMAAESGKPTAEALGEWNYAKGYVDWFAGEAERVYGDIITLPRPGVRALVRKEPVGVVGVITPWNFPAAMVTRAVAGALAAGCTVVLKPSELTPFTATALAKLATDAGVPDGVFNVVTGQATDVGPALTGSPIVRKLSFTGSTAVGVKLYQQCAPTVKKLALELGGNAPVIVCADAEMDLVVDGIMSSKFRNAGQACIALNRLYVAASRHDELVETLVSRVKRDLHCGDGGHSKLGGDRKVSMGPLITVAQANRVADAVSGAIKQGAKVACGGAAVDGLAANFYQPTVLTDVTSDMDIANAEIFGPVVSVIKYADDDLDGVIAAANNVPVGLAAYVYTSDYRKQWKLSEALQYGMVGVNEGAISAPQCPFGGVKQSGLGRDGSKYGIEQFLETKYVLMGGKI